MASSSTAAAWEKPNALVYTASQLQMANFFIFGIKRHLKHVSFYVFTESQVQRDIYAKVCVTAQSLNTNNVVSIKKKILHSMQR